MDLWWDFLWTRKLSLCHNIFLFSAWRMEGPSTKLSQLLIKVIFSKKWFFIEFDERNKHGKYRLYNSNKPWEKVLSYYLNSKEILELLIVYS